MDSRDEIILGVGISVIVIAGAIIWWQNNNAAAAAAAMQPVSVVGTPSVSPNSTVPQCAVAAKMQQCAMKIQQNAAKIAPGTGTFRSNATDAAHCAPTFNIAINPATLDS